MVKEIKPNNKMGIIGYVDNGKLSGGAKVVKDYLDGITDTDKNKEKLEKRREIKKCIREILVENNR